MSLIRYTSWGIVAAVCLFAAAGVVEAQGGTASAAGAAPAGTYTAEQAKRGEKVYNETCAACHLTEEFSGEDFKLNWHGRSAFDLFSSLRTTMPQDNPGGLSAQQYSDVIAYIFKINGAPAGNAALPIEADALKKVKIEIKGARKQGARAP
jgi:mono/diheme cytochrome c family protein